MFEIRKAGTDDVPLIRELTFMIWPQTYAAILSEAQISYMLELMYSRESLEKQMTAENCTFLILYENGNPVGFASYGETEPGNWKLHKIYVLQSLQGKGAGRFMINYILDEIRSLHARVLQLQVNRYNRAKEFYEKLGFTVSGKADFDIGNGYFMNDYIMEKQV